MKPIQSLPNSKIFLPVFISWKEAQVLARQYLVGMEFNVSQFKVVIKDLSVREQAGKVYLELHTHGSFDGNITATFLPKFYKDKNKIEFEAFDLQMNTSNFFQKGIITLLRGAIERQLAKALDFTLDQPLGQLLQVVNQQLTDFKATPQLKIKGNISEVEVLDFSYDPKGIQLEVTAEGKLTFFVDAYYEDDFHSA